MSALIGFPMSAVCKKEPANKADFLTVKGCGWNHQNLSIAALGVDERFWQRFGCATRSTPNQPEVWDSWKCAAPNLGLSPDVTATLKEVIPNTDSNSCLENYEYAKHGACFGFDPNAYFKTIIQLDKAIKGSELGQFLADNYGKTVSHAAFNSVVEKTWGKG